MGIVRRELANIKRALPLQLPLPPGMMQVFDWVMVGLLILLMLGFVISMLVLLPDGRLHLLLGVGLACQIEFMMTTIQARAAQLLQRERLQNTWNAIRLTTLSDGTLVGGKLHALLRTQWLVWLFNYVPRALMLGGVVKLVWAGTWRVSHWAEGVVGVGGGLLLLGWLTLYPLLGGLSHALVGVAASTIGPPRFTNFLAGLLWWGLICGYVAAQLGVQVGLYNLARVGLPAPVFAAYWSAFPYFVWAQMVVTQTLLYLLVGALSLWVLRKRLPFLTE